MPMEVNLLPDWGKGRNRQDMSGPRHDPTGAKRQPGQRPEMDSGAQLPAGLVDGRAAKPGGRAFCPRGQQSLVKKDFFLPMGKIGLYSKPI